MATFAAGAALALGMASAAQARDKVTLMLNWYTYGEHAPFYLGVERGYFAAENIDLDIQEGRGSAVTVQAVAAGSTTLGYADVSTMIKAAAKGAPVVTVGVMLQKSPASVMGFAEKNIVKPADIKGRTVAMTPGDSLSQLWPVYLKANHLSDDDYKPVSGDATTKRNAVVNGRADLLHAAVMHDGEAIGNRERLFLVVGDENRGEAQTPLERANFLAHFGAQLGIEIRERFVEQEHVGTNRQRAGDRHALLLTARELARVAVGQLGQPHHVEGFADARGTLGARHAPHLQSERHVLGHGHVRKEGVALEHHARVAAMRGQARDFLAADPYFSRRGLDEARHHAQRGGLAAATRAEERDELAFGDLQREVRHGSGVAVLLAQSAQRNVGHVRSPG